jgi:hypothetical protein
MLIVAAPLPYLLTSHLISNMYKYVRVNYDNFLDPTEAQTPVAEHRGQPREAINTPLQPFPPRPHHRTCSSSNATRHNAIGIVLPTGTRGILTKQMKAPARHLVIDPRTSDDCTGINPDDTDGTLPFQTTTASPATLSTHMHSARPQQPDHQTRPSSATTAQKGP